MDLLWTHYGLSMDSHITNLHFVPTHPKIIQVIIHIQIALQKIQDPKQYRKYVEAFGI